MRTVAAAATAVRHWRFSVACSSPAAASSRGCAPPALRLASSAASTRMHVSARSAESTSCKKRNTADSFSAHPGRARAAAAAHPLRQGLLVLGEVLGVLSSQLVPDCGARRGTRRGPVSSQKVVGGLGRRQRASRAAPAPRRASRPQRARRRQVDGTRHKRTDVREHGRQADRVLQERDGFVAAEPEQHRVLARNVRLVQGSQRRGAVRRQAHQNAVVSLERLRGEF